MITHRNILSASVALFAAAFLVLTLPAPAMASGTEWGTYEGGGSDWGTYDGGSDWGAYDGGGSDWGYYDGGGSDWGTYDGGGSDWGSYTGGGSDWGTYDGGGYDNGSYWGSYDGGGYTDYPYTDYPYTDYPYTDYPYTDYTTNTGYYEPGYDNGYYESFYGNYGGNNGYYEAGYQGGYQSSYQSAYEAGYQGSYQSAYQAGYQSSYEAGYQGSYESYYQGSYHHDENVSCDISADDTSIDEGDDVRLRWTSDNADSARINQNIGSVSTNGTRTVHPDDDTTYTLTVRNGNDSETCDVTIRVSTHRNTNLSCDLTASDTTIDRGDTTTLRWDTDGDIDDARINQGIGSVDEDGGTERVSPNVTTTYRLTVENDNGDDDFCDVTIRVGDDNLPPPPDVPLVFLSELPYTGTGDDPGALMTYWLLIIAGAGIAGYVLFFRVMPFALAAAAPKLSTASEARSDETLSAVENVTRQDVRAFVSALSARDALSAREFANTNRTALFAETAVVLDDVLKAREGGTPADPSVLEMTKDWDTKKIQSLVDAFLGGTDADDTLDQALA